MKKQWLSSILLCALIAWPMLGVWAQSHRVVYPIKQDHQWGFMSKRGEVLVAPRYDAIGEPVTLQLSPSTAQQDDENPLAYRLVEINGKLGVIDYNLQEVLACEYDYILPISADQFLVKQAEGYTVVDTTGHSLSEQYYPQLEFAGATKDGICLYTRKEEGKTGIINARGDILLPSIFAEVQLLEWRSDLFLTKMKANATHPWVLSSATGALDAPRVRSAISPHPGMLLIVDTEAKQYEQYTAHNAFGRPIPALNGLTFTGGEYISPVLVRLDMQTWNATKQENEYRHLLFHVQEKKVILPNFLNFEYLDGAYCSGTSYRPAPMGSNKVILKTLIGPQGQLIDTSIWYRTIQAWPGTEQSYKVRGTGGWGIIDQESTTLIPTEYRLIGPVERGLSIVQRNDLQGMVTAAGRTVIAPEYTRIRYWGNRLSLENGEGTSIMYLDDSLNVMDIREYRRSRALHVNPPPSALRIAKTIRWKSLQSSGMAAPFTNSDSIPDLDLDDKRYSRWFHGAANQPDTTLAVIPLPVTIAAGLTKDFIRQYGAPNNSPRYFMRFYAKKEVAPPAFLRYLAGSAFCLRPQRLFADEAGVLYPEPVFGLRSIDYLDGWDYAPALAMNGRFILMGKDGDPLRNPKGETMHFTFVGQTNNGLLRVCVGGKIDKVETNEDNREQLPLFHQIIADLGLRTSCASIRDYGPRLTVRDSARWGIIDSLGRWLIPPVYDYLEENINGQMVARKGNYFGVIDQNHDTIVPFQYLAIRESNSYWRVNSHPIGDLYFNWRGHQIMDAETEDAAEFQNGYCARKTGGRWHFIDETGQRIGEENFLAVRAFGEGLAAVQLDSSQWAFIDTSGQVHKTLSPTSVYHDLGRFVEGRCWFRRGASFGFLDTAMQEVIRPLYRSVGNFTNGRATVYLKRGAAVIDQAGKNLIPPGVFTEFQAWNAQGLTVATVSNVGQFLIDTLGQRLHTKAYDRIILEGEGPYAMQMGNFWGYINAQGEEVIRPKYRLARPFFEERAAVQPSSAGGRWVFINPQDQVINRQNYNFIRDFSEGLAMVSNQNSPTQLIQLDGKKRRFSKDDILFTDGQIIGCKGSDGKKFFADQYGNRVFANLFDDIEPFGSAETAAVTLSKRKGIVDRRGMLLVACKYYKFDKRDDGTYMVGPPAFGIYNRDGELIVPPEFDQLLFVEGELFRVEQGEKVGYLKTDGKVVWPLQN